MKVQCPHARSGSCCVLASLLPFPARTTRAAGLFRTLACLSVPRLGWTTAPAGGEKFCLSLQPKFHVFSCGPARCLPKFISPSGDFVATDADLLLVVFFLFCRCAHVHKFLTSIRPRAYPGGLLKKSPPNTETLTSYSRPRPNSIVPKPIGPTAQSVPQWHKFSCAGRVPLDRAAALHRV